MVLGALVEEERERHLEPHPQDQAMLVELSLSKERNEEGRTLSAVVEALHWIWRLEFSVAASRPRFLPPKHNDMKMSVVAQSKDEL